MFRIAREGLNYRANMLLNAFPSKRQDGLA